MIIERTVDVEIEVEPSEMLVYARTADLVDELESRSDHVSGLDIQSLYSLLSLKRHEEVIRMITEFVEFKTGRIVP